MIGMTEFQGAGTDLSEAPFHLLTGLISLHTFIPSPPDGTANVFSITNGHIRVVLLGVELFGGGSSQNVF